MKFVSRILATLAGIGFCVSQQASGAQIPASYAKPAGSGDTAGMTVRLVQATTQEGNTVASAENRLKGVNAEQITGRFLDAPQVINYNQAYPQPPVPDLGLGDTFAFPGVDLQTDSNYLAAEIVTYLALQAGTAYRFQIISDDTHSLSVGPVASDVALVLNTDNNPFEFTVEANGVYPFRLVYQQGTGGANVQWIEEQAPGVFLLINDPNQPAATKAYRNNSTMLNAVSMVQQPQGVSVVANRTAEFSASASALSGSIVNTNVFAYQWQLNQVDIPGATWSVYRTAMLTTADSGGKYRCVITLPGYPPVVSTEATLTVTPDGVAPMVTSVAGGANLTTVKITFDEVVDSATASALTSYVLGGGLTLNNVVFDVNSPSNVVLQTSAQSPGVTYTVTIKDVTDLSGNTIVQVVKSFKTLSIDAGFLVQEYYGDIGGGNTSDLVNNAKFQNGTPDSLRTLYSSEVPASFPNNPGGFGTRIFGFVIPPVNGAYTFYVAGYEGVELYLSSNSDPANKTLIATDTDDVTGVQGTTGVREWTKYLAQESAPQTLTAGVAYYLEGLHKQAGAGSENFGIAWTKPGEAVSTINVIPGKYLAGYADTNFPATLTISAQPVDVTLEAGSKATFTVAVTGVSAYGTNVGYQWQKAGVDIEDAINASYTTPSALVADSGSKYKCRVMVPGKREVSAQATLTVTPAPPFVIVSAIPLHYPGYSKATVKFSNPLVDATATNVSNYGIGNGVVISSAALWDEHTVILTTSAQMTADQAYTVTINNVSDRAGNTVPPNTTFAVKQITPRPQDPGVQGLIVAEVERYDRVLSRYSGSTLSYWTNATTWPGFSGECAMQALPDAGKNAGSAITISPRIDFQVDCVQTGPLYFWIHGTAPYGGSSDSVFMGLDEVIVTRNSDPTSSKVIDGFNYDLTYKWGNRNQIEVLTPGLHVVTVWMREDGFVANKIILSTDPAYVPSGFGPDDTRLGPAPAVSLAIRHAGNNVVVTWNTANGTGFALKTSAVVGAGASWTAVPQPVATSGDLSSVTIPIGGTPQFYRLEK